jgi:hypothetical protein
MADQTRELAPCPYAIVVWDKWVKPPLPKDIYAIVI